MNILHLAPFFPSTNAIHAGGVCMGKEVNELLKFNNVYSLSFVQEKYDCGLFQKEKRSMDYALFLSKKKKIINILTHPFIAPIFSARSSGAFYKKMIRIIKENNIQAVHAEYTSMAQYCRIKKLFPNLRYNVVLHDVTVQSYERQLESTQDIIRRIWLRLNLGLVYRNERNWLSKADTIIVFTEKDRKLVKDRYNLDNVIRINTEFGIEDTILKRETFKRKDDDNFGIAFLGQMGRSENLQAAERLISIFDHNIKQKQHIVIHIIGNNPPKNLKQKENGNIIITGYIEDIDKYLLENCDIAVFPLIVGAGIKIKVLRCMALGMPIVTNQIGAEGIDEKGDYLYLAETDKEFAKAIIDLKNQNSYVCNTEIAFVTKQFSWNLTRAVFAQLYK